MDEHNIIHALGVLRGAVEGDTTLYLGSLLALSDHMNSAESLGLVSIVDEWEANPTELGRYLYDNYLKHLPEGRAYLWQAGSSSNEELVSMAYRDVLNARKGR